MRKLFLVLLFLNAEIAKTAPPTLTPEIADIINYQGTDVPEKAYVHGNMADAAQQKAEGESGRIVSNSFARQGEYKISHRDSFLDKAHHAQTNPESYVDWLSGKYEDCKQEGGEEVFSKERHTCDEYQELKEQSCHIGHLIEVDAKHNYECLRKRDRFAKVCTKTLSVAIEEKENCDSGTIAWISGGSMRQEYPYIHISPAYRTMNGLLNKDYIDAYISIITFQVKDISSIREISIESLNGDTALEIIVNDIVAYTNLNTGNIVGGSSKDVLHFGKRNQTPQITDQGKLPIDVLKYIKPGLNGVIFKSVTGKPVTAILRTKQNCKSEVDIWTEVCSKEGGL